MPVIQETALIPVVAIHLCVPDDQESMVPKRRRTPLSLPHFVPLPRVGEVVYLSSTSAWVVTMVLHEWRNAIELRIEIWLDHVGGARHLRPTGSELTQ